MSRSKALQSYILVRLLLAPLMLFTIVTIVFVLVRATGDPADAVLGARASEAAKTAWRSQKGLDGPLVQQYFDYLKDLLHFDLGSSILSSNKPVWGVIQEHFPATVELSLCSIVIAVVVGVSIGMISASSDNKFLDVLGRLFGIITYSLPLFWIGMILQLIFAVNLGWFPLSNRFPLDAVGTPTPPTVTGLYLIDSVFAGNLSMLWHTIHYLALPSLTLGILLSGIFERIVRVNLRQTLKSDYVEAARARGISEKTILVSHAMKNALIPVITILGLTFASLLGGAVLTEVTFSWPGLGRALYDAIGERDYLTVQGIMVFFGTIIVFASIIIDIINACIDPRIRY